MRSTDWHGAASALLLLLRRRRRRLRTRRLASRKSLVDHFPAFAHEILVKGGDVEAGGDVRHHLRHDGKQLRKKEMGVRGEERLVVRRRQEHANKRMGVRATVACGAPNRGTSPCADRSGRAYRHRKRAAAPPLARTPCHERHARTHRADTSPTKLRNRRYRRWRSSEHGATTVCHSADGTT